MRPATSFFFIQLSNSRGIAGLVGGGGGGRPNMAQAGGKDPAGIDQAIAQVSVVLESQL